MYPRQTTHADILQIAQCVSLNTIVWNGCIDDWCVMNHLVDVVKTMRALTDMSVFTQVDAVYERTRDNKHGLHVYRIYFD